ncbi:uncharacterized protein LOC120359723 [Solenopsis invicta]|uniref:uncharacterized protein LOC120359723 n=1 Tax=Solenopsis invicta TaxID=13686 RepID=UPI00193DE31D|nr:uncharacterized protein LOC120359723 [Solenopsis invicta]
MSWNDDIAYAMNPIKFLTPLGVWPLQKYNTSSLVRYIVCIINMIVMTIVMFLELNFGNDDAYIKIHALYAIYSTVLCILKLLTFRLYADNLTRNFSSAVNDYLAIDNKEKRIIMRRHAFMGRMICYSIVLLIYLAVLIIILTPTITSYSEAIQVNVTIKIHVSELPVPLTFLGDFQIPTNVYLALSMMELLICIINATCNCGKKLIINTKKFAYNVLFEYNLKSFAFYKIY